MSPHSCAISMSKNSGPAESSSMRSSPARRFKMRFWGETGLLDALDSCQGIENPTKWRRLPSEIARIILGKGKA